MILINIFKIITTLILYIKFIGIFHNHIYNEKIYCLILESLRKIISLNEIIIISLDQISYLYKYN